MWINVKFFASLRELMNRAETRVELPEGGSVEDVWLAATDGREQPANVLAAVNMEYVDFSAPVSDGDEVAFFPPVTGG
ncbi:molybdopterin synthase sulfur carrier subunit [Thiohalobacter sp. COW1]|uniref:Molybdopterin synthase sulfur carrier subunit n=1 Tax=Thiohalobacter thiocyanaticus TaxID=585455 RepID=A0A1Z4VNE7_9GAMM|nr:MULTISPECIES: molybdopterin converting factor subunit 1 [Thiohalobacter]BAZ93156.1 molybdopterin synthase subunit MoaD [Thiohalobacter thiocyanaticus]BCO31832.1 molybdopterin synthase sulfur carrier subunit [Thiohalobacter sp. COW1]